MSTWKCAGAQIQGSNHKENDRPGQDRIGHVNRGAVSVLALADGAGYSRRAQLGAEASVAVISNLLANSFSELFDNPNGAEVKSRILGAIHSALTEVSHFLSCKFSALASTLLAVAVKDDKIIMCHIGDGVIGIVDNGLVKVASFPTNGEYANTTTFTTSPDALKVMKLSKSQLGDISGIVLMSDGSAESLYDKRKKSLSPDILTLVRVVKNETLEDASIILENLLAEYVAPRTGDDCSVAVAARVNSRELVPVLTGSALTVWENDSSW